MVHDILVRQGGNSPNSLDLAHGPKGKVIRLLWNIHPPPSHNQGKKKKRHNVSQNAN